MSKKYLFPAGCRIRQNWEYRKIQQTGHKITFKNFTVLHQIREDGSARLGLIVSRKVGGAVQRNRVKRLVREFFRRNRDKLPARRDFVVIAKREASQLSYLSVAGELSGLFCSKTYHPEGGRCFQNR